MEWINVADQLPSKRTKVIAFYRNQRGKARVVVAEYIPKFSIRCSYFYDPETAYEADYIDEDDEEGFVKESWHEVLDNWPDYASCPIINGAVTHWMEMPLPPN